MPQAYYQDPQRVEADGGRITVHYADGRRQDLHRLGRQDLMKVAGAIAKTQGTKTGGTSWTNDQLVAFIAGNTPWTLQGGDKAPDTPQGGDDDNQDQEPGQEKEGVPFRDKEGTLRVLVPVPFKCGHTVPQRVQVARKESTIAWLAKKDCPKCRLGLPQGGEEAPKAPEKDQEAPEGQDLPQGAPAPFDMDDIVAKVTQRVLEALRNPAPPQDPDQLYHEVYPKVLGAVRAGFGDDKARKVNVMLSGAPGVSKTHIASQVAEALGIPFEPFSCQPQMSDDALFGYVSPITGEYMETPLYRAFVNGALFLMDEMDNGNQALTTGLNMVLANRVGVFGGKVLKAHPNFCVIAGVNTAGIGPEAGHLGREGLDRATLDRMFKIYVGIDGKLEAALAKRMAPQDHARIVKAVRKLRKVIEARGLHHDVYVTPRTTYDSCALISAGACTLREALEGTGLKTLDALTTTSILDEVLGEGVDN